MSTSMTKKLVAYHIARLKDKSVEVRLKSIEELVQLGDADALPALEDLFKTETDMDVKRAAQAAGKTIYTASKSAK